METRTVFNYKQTENNWNGISKERRQLFVHNELPPVILILDSKERSEMGIA